MKKIEVVAAVIVKDGKVLSTQRGYGKYEDFWEFPGGKIEGGESHKEALTREIREELDIQINVGEYLTTIEYVYPEYEMTMHCYKCTIESGDIRLLEHKAMAWLTADDMLSPNWLPSDLEFVSSLKSSEKFWKNCK